MRTIGDAVARAALAMTGRRSPWGGGNGNGPNDSGNDPSSDPKGEGQAGGQGGGEPPRGPRNPWAAPGDSAQRRSASIEDIFRGKGPRRPGGGGGGFPGLPERPDGKSWWPLIVGGAAAVWLVFTTGHLIGPKEQGVVTTFGKYARTVGPGLQFTLPWPFQALTVKDVTSIKLDTIPEGEAEKLMLTSDQNLVDLSYLIRWNIKDLKLYTFQVDKPEETVREVAEAAMRASVAEVSLVQALSGSGRAQIEQNVRTRMQAILDGYKAGVTVQGVEIKKADPPEKVKGAFQQVTAAQQDAQRDQSNAQAWAQQLLARAQGDAAAFDKVYEQYRLAPEVTKRRMYYETMERVLSANDKVIVEGNGVTPYLPLSEIQRKRDAQPATGGQ